MTDKITYQHYFNQLSKMSPKLNMLEAAVSTSFWEDLYRVFAARFIDEQNKQLKAMMEQKKAEEADKSNLPKD